MQVLALIESPDHVCYRYRLRAFAPALAERGLGLRAEPLAGSLGRRIRQMRAARGFRVVILQRKLLPLWQLWILRRAAPCLLYDVDDAVFQRDSFHRKPPQSWQRLVRFWATVYAADRVIVGNPYLRDRAACYAEPDRVRVIPTCVELRQYPLASHHRAGHGVRLVWIGQQSTLPSLACVERHLAAAAKTLLVSLGPGAVPPSPTCPQALETFRRKTLARPGLELWVVCDRSFNLSGVRVVPRQWSSATEAVDLAQCDIGISWLPDDDWSRGKCGLKVLQYMAAGLPVVANPVGMNSAMVVHGQTGFLASEPAEWAAAIGRLARDPQLRQRMGAAGRRFVEARFSVAGWGPEFAALVASAAGASVPLAVPGSPEKHAACAERETCAQRGRLRRPAPSASQVSRPRRNVRGQETLAQRGLFGFLSFVMLTCGLAGVGCTVTSRLTLPATHSVVRDQLVIRSDFPLAAKHRLLEELTARRGDLKDRLGLPSSDEPIYVYLFKDPDRFAGFVRLYYPDFPPRRAYFLETDTQLRVYAQWGDRVAEDLRHEVTHAYLHSVVPNIPLWLDEGLAEYFEVPRGSQGMNGPHLELLYDHLQQGRWRPDLVKLEALRRPFEMTQRQYAESWAWVHFLLETYPERRALLQEYLQELRREGSTKPLSERLRRWTPEPWRDLAEYVESLAAAAGWHAAGDGGQEVGGGSLSTPIQ